ncbi:hypothetical protein DFJ58DRAFT_907932 [Suillus subalutaceus]|uniref:uncharacterized protein n=1 Tax=Suillus subalutaceus TaxID=48586 RepID=UPI001B87EB0F|nr:uncharacterized protein DFJ58DRAFT_907932 [Suillus subalutaceus]KAG1840195.1 hypothetical protein DFJ58DRAFT_907932 [Suillus subalutaceus]
MLADHDVEDETSYFDDLTRECNAFRILLIGKSGSGKSTLVNEVFDFEYEGSTTSDYSVGNHDINRPILSSANRSLILHDSKGLESGSDKNLNIVKRFLNDRKNGPVTDQLHAIWYCVEIPLGGERLFEGGDLVLMEYLKSSSVPLIVVFTKLDKLQFSERMRLQKEYTSNGQNSKAMRNAKEQYVAAAAKKYQSSCVDVLQSPKIPQAWSHYCAVSMKQSQTIITLIELTKSLLDSSETLDVLFSQAQMPDVNYKVNLSLRAGKNMYRTGMFASALPLKGIRKVSLLKVLSVIHSDIVRVWNLQDPDEILLGANMRTMIRRLFVEPLILPTLDGAAAASDGNSAQIIASIAGACFNPATLIAPAVNNAVQILDDMADTAPSAARVLMAYIIDLTLGMESLYWLVRRKDGKTASEKDVIEAFSHYHVSESRKEAHKRIRNFIGDENIFLSVQREKVLSKAGEIVGKCRINPKKMFKGRQ